MFDSSCFVYLSDSFLSRVSGGEGDEGVAPVEAGHGVHHQAEVPDGAALFEQRNQIALVYVAWNLATKYLHTTEECH